MGYIGDTYGRKRALETSIFLMAFPTFTMGVLPPYSKIGWLSPVLLITVRLLQGLSAGGQLMSSLVFTLEKQPKEHWGLYGSYVMASANAGVLLGSVVNMLLERCLTEEQLRTWGWRLPFLSGVLVLVSGIYLRFYCEEDAMEHHTGGSSTKKNPLKEAFAKENRRMLLSASIVPAIWGTGFYMNFVWMATYVGEEYVGYPQATGSTIVSLSLLLSVCLLFPIAGIVSDWYGREKIMYLGGVLLFVASPLMFSNISKGNPFVAFFSCCSLGICLSLWSAPSK